ncbi:MAG: hypothetical protein WC848_04640 [Parcubacteria group bacterium]
MFEILKPADFTPEIVAQVLDLGKRSGTWQDSDVDYYKDQFQNPRNINIVHRNGDNRISGYILARPHNEAVLDYLIEDPVMAASDVGMFYVDIVIADKNSIRPSIGMLLITEMIREANNRRVSRFSFHCRVVTGFSKRIQKEFGAEIIRRIERYVDCNEEPFDYIETIAVA